MRPNRIMIVEDEVVVSADIKAKLEKMNYTVPAIVRYGEDALDAAVKHKPDLILMDIRLKGEMDGTQAAWDIQAKLGIPVIFLTAYTDEQTLNNAKAATPFGYLIKPVRLEELRVSIDVALYKASMERQLKESELRFRTVADFAYDWEVWIGPDQEYRHISPSCERISGYPPEAFIKNAELMIDIIAPEDRESVKTHFYRCYRPNETHKKLEFRIIRIDGEERWIEHLCQSVYSPDGEYMGRRASNRDITWRKKIELDRTRLIGELKQALDEVKQLSGLLPICSFCKRIRDDKGYWNMLETYISERSEAQFSHSVCEDCMKKHYPDLMG